MVKNLNPTDYKGTPINPAIPGLDGPGHIRADLQILIQLFPTLAGFDIREHLFGKAGPQPGQAQSAILCPFQFKIMQANGYSVASGHDLTRSPSAEHVVVSVHPHFKIKLSDYMCAVLFCPGLSAQGPEMDNFNIHARSLAILKQ